MNMIKIVGRAEDLGRPLLYGTTKRFLEVFGLAGLDDLPQVDALKGGGSAAPAVKIQQAEAIQPNEVIEQAEMTQSAEAIRTR
jgi:segregation and condensation protein B